MFLITICVPLGILACFFCLDSLFILPQYDEAHFGSFCSAAKKGCAQWCSSAAPPLFRNSLTLEQEPNDLKLHLITKHSEQFCTPLMIHRERKKKEEGLQNLLKTCFLSPVLSTDFCLWLSLCFSNQHRWPNEQNCI